MSGTLSLALVKALHWCCEERCFRAFYLYQWRNSTVGASLSFLKITQVIFQPNEFLSKEETKAECGKRLISA